MLFRSVVARVKESRQANFGFDADAEEYVDMIKAGILDPAKVTRTALQNAASIASLMLTTECLVAEVPEDEKAAVRAAIDKFQEDLEAGQAGGGAAPAPMSKVELAQAKAKVITKARSEARAKGMTTEDEKAFVAEAIKKFSDEQAAGGAPAAAAPKKEMSKIELAQAKAKVITKARNEARAKGMSTEDEKKFVAEALKKFSAEQAG